MQSLRRRLASCALALIVFQAALPFAAPWSSCCPSRTSAATARADDKDCCPAGAHKPGECPRHARPQTSAKTAAKTVCRVQCDAPHGVQFLVGAIGVLTAPATHLVSLDAEPLPTAASPALIRQSFIPDLPPPRRG